MTHHPWFRFHLSTLLILQPIAAALIWANCLPPYITWADESDTFFRWSGWPFAAYDWMDTESFPNAYFLMHFSQNPSGRFRNWFDIFLNVTFCVTLLFCIGLLWELWLRRREIKIAKTTMFLVAFVLGVILCLNIFPVVGCPIDFRQNGKNYLTNVWPIAEESCKKHYSRYYGWPFVCSEIAHGNELMEDRRFRLNGWDDSLKNVAVAIILLTVLGLCFEWLARRT